jgi:hypothetical protein
MSGMMFGEASGNAVDLGNDVKSAAQAVDAVISGR